MAKALVNDQAIVFEGLMGFKAGSPDGLFETILDNLRARTLQNGRRVHPESVDKMVVYHDIPSADAVKILEEYGIEARLAKL